MKIDASYRAASAVQRSPLGRLLLAVGFVLLAAGLYRVLSDFGSCRSGYGPLVIWASCFPLLMRNTLEGPAVLAIEFWPAMFSYRRGFIFKAVRIRKIARISAEGQVFRVIHKNGSSFLVPCSEFPGVDFETLARHLEKAATTHVDLAWFFQMNSVPGFGWIDPALRQALSDKEKKIAVVFFASLVLALTAWAFYVFMRV